MSESQNESHPWRETNLNEQNAHPSDSQSDPHLKGQIQSHESRSLELAHTQKQIIHHQESIGDQSTPIHLGLFDETIQQSKKLLALDPGNVDAALNLSYAYKQTQKFEAAKQILECTFEYEPQSPEMLFQLGVLALEMKDYKDSIQWLNRYLKLSPRDEHAYFNLGLAHLESGHLIEAMGYYHQALVLNPHLLNAYYELGWIYLNQGLYPEVIDLYEKALSLHTEKSEYADSHRESLKRDIPDVSLYINLARAYRFEKQYENAFKCYEKALELQPDKAFTHYCLALAYLEIQKPVEAEKSLVLSTQLDPNFAEAWYELGLLKARNREFDAARECLEKVIALHPEDANAWIDLGSLFDCHHESKKAISCFEKALALNPVNEKEIWFKLGLAYDALEKFRDAETSYKKALSLSPTYHAALYSLGYHYAFLTHQTEAAMEIFQEGILSHPEEVLFYKALSKLYVER
ncbi:MAG: tetratricopeptide repeat protein, partial [Cyanobacteria bacterium]|nr:tetratricopeptide repeat protein [Cyanobacteriota bacterium]